MSGYDHAVRSREIVRRLWRVPVFLAAKTIMLYASAGSEVSTDAVIESALKRGKKVVLPRVDKKTGKLCAQLVTDMTADCAPGSFGVREPHAVRCPVVSPRNIDVVVVPGLAFGRDGSRLGHGKGFYDAWLRGIPAEKRIGIAFDNQVVSTLPAEAHDSIVSTIVTEKRVIKTETVKKPVKTPKKGATAWRT